MSLGFITREIAQRELGSPAQFNDWLRLGYLPPPIRVVDASGTTVELIPTGEWRYVVSLLAAGKEWHELAATVKRLVRLRQKVPSIVRPQYLDVEPEQHEQHEQHEQVEVVA